MNKLVSVLIGLGLVVAAVAADLTTGNSAMPAFRTKTWLAENSIDFSSTSVAPDEVINLIAIPANSLVQAVTYEVVSAVYPTNVAVAIGDNSSSTRFRAEDTASAAGSQTISSYATAISVSGVVGGTNVTLSGSVNLPLPLLYTATNSINAIAYNAVPTAGVIRVRAVITDLNLP